MKISSVLHYFTQKVRVDVNGWRKIHPTCFMRDKKLTTYYDREYEMLFTPECCRQHCIVNNQLHELQRFLPVSLRIRKKTPQSYERKESNRIQVTNGKQLFVVSGSSVEIC